MNLTTGSKRFALITFNVWLAIAVSTTSSVAHSKAKPEWLKVSDFESSNALQSWTKIDTQNQTDPKVENPQVTEVRFDSQANNHYLLKKPAPEGIVGNRKAISFTKLPNAIDVGETYTFTCA